MNTFQILNNEPFKYINNIWTMKSLGFVFLIYTSVRVISLAFGSADNSYLDIDNSAYHKNLIQ